MHEVCYLLLLSLFLSASSPFPSPRFFLFLSFLGFFSGVLILIQGVAFNAGNQLAAAEADEVAGGALVAIIPAMPVWPANKTLGASHVTPTSCRKSASFVFTRTQLWDL